jgi:hypothetical protein
MLTMPSDEWCIITDFISLAEAEVINSLLEEDGVETRFEPSDQIMAAITGVRLMVESYLEHRAKWILKRNDFTDEELHYLATGELPQKKST